MRVLHLCVFMLLAATASAKTYYVDAVAGKDAASGLSEQEAWKTLARVGAAGFAPGDRILLRRGQTWRTQLTIPSSGASGAPLTIGAYGSGPAPVISGANVLTGWTSHQGSIWKASCPSAPNIAACGGTVGQRKTALSQLAASRDWFWSGGVFYLHAPVRPDQAYAAPGVEAAARDYCIYANKKSYIQYENLTLTWANRSCLRSQGGDTGLHLTQVCARGAGDQGAYEFDACANITLDRCVAEHSRAVSVGDGFMFKGGCSDVTLRNCKAAYNMRRGAQFDTGIGGHLRIFGGEFHHQWGTEQSDGISIDDNDGVFIEGAWSHDNGPNNQGIDPDSCDGIQISGWSRNPVVRYCRLENNYNGGLILESDGGTLTYNISAGNRHGIAICGNPTLPLKIYNNTCYNNEYGFFFYEKAALADVSVMNNIFYGVDGQRRAIHVDTGLSTARLKLDYNCLWGDSNSTAIKWGAASYSRSQIGAYRSATGQDAHSIAADPLFVNAAARDFHLRAGSPCIDRGLGLAFTRDFAGRAVPYNALPDIGALEYAPATIPRVSSITRLDPDPNRNATVRYGVAFSEAVTGVDTKDFSVASGAPNGAAVASLGGGGSQYTIGVATGAGDGKLQLLLMNNGSIVSLGGAPLGGAGVTGPTYRIDRTPPQSKVTGITAQLVNGVNGLHINYTAGDAVALDHVRLYYRKNRTGTFLSYGGEIKSSPIAFVPLAGAGLYEFYTRGVDLAGNAETPPAVSDMSATVSSKPAAARDWRDYQ